MIPPPPPPPLSFFTRDRTSSCLQEPTGHYTGKFTRLYNTLRVMRIKGGANSVGKDR